jgi:hypothetical protein
MTCRYDPECTREPLVARGLCQTHYTQARNAGRLNEFPRKTDKGPKGPRTVATIGPSEDRWGSVPTPSAEELRSKAFKVMQSILDNPKAPQAERNTVLRIIGSWKDKGMNDAERDKLRGILRAVRGEEE